MSILEPAREKLEKLREKLELGKLDRLKKARAREESRAERFESIQHEAEEIKRLKAPRVAVSKARRVSLQHDISQVGKNLGMLGSAIGRGASRVARAESRSRKSSKSKRVNQLWTANDFKF
jgi:hypothetical protein